MRTVEKMQNYATLMERNRDALPRLRQAIIDNTRGEELFWLGEILLAELEKETGFSG